MSKAIIIFADGSKQMAHNLDDLRMRWYERKVTKYDEIKAEINEGIVLPDFDLTNDMETAKSQKQTWLDLRIAIMEREAFLMRVNNTLLNRKFLHSIRAIVENEIAKTNRRISVLSREQTLKDARDTTTKNSKLHHKINELTQELLTAQAEIIRLQKILIDQFHLDEKDVINLIDKTGS